MSLSEIFYQVDGLLRILSEVDRLRTSCVYTIFLLFLHFCIVLDIRDPNFLFDHLESNSHVFDEIG